MKDQFTHLHVHSDHSILDGGSKPGWYANRARELGQPALAITDHGSLSGAFRHWKECRENGIKPIIGCEFYVAPGSRLARDTVSGFSGSGKYSHLTVLASSSEGLRNLYRLQAHAHSSGFYGKPRIDFALLEEHREGLIVLSGCAGSHISTYLRQGDDERAVELARRLKDSFGENFFIEIMNHGIKEDDLDEEVLNRDLVALAVALDIQMVGTNDSHYCNPEDHDVQQALLCVSTRDVLSNPKRFRFNGEGFYLKSRAEMDRLGLPQEALDNTVRIAEQVGSYDEVFAHSLRMPKYSEDEGYDLEWEAVHSPRWGPHGSDISGMPEEYQQRLGYELEVINSMGYPGYFLVEAHILREARKRGIRIGPGRGSAGGSLVAYSLGITDLDPIAHGLLFERFINPERISLPDIDVDVAESQRPEFIELVRELYGGEHVAIIGTQGTIGAKAALKDANRVLGGTYAAGERYTKNLPPPKFGRSPGLDQYSGKEDQVVQLAKGFEGLIRSVGQHAAGVIISPDPLVDDLPLWHPANQETWVTGFDMHELEELGFVKLDYLGLRNLDIIDDCLRTVRSAETSATLSGLPTLPNDCSDPATYELLASGHTLGVFQLDSPGMRGLLRLLRPKKFDDISAVLALYRPGPMGANAHTEFAHRANKPGGWRAEWSIHPDLEEALRPVLEDTYGLIVFQEQVLAALNVICGWSYAEAGLLFDAMRKKNHEKMEATRPSYLSAARAKGFSDEALEALWNTLVPFADYSFNRSHTAGYGLLAYWTAYLKANHPTEYMCSLLSSVSDDPDRLHEYLRECERLGIRLLAPDINVSQEGFTPDGKDIRYGLAAIKGVGEKAFLAISRKRSFSNFGDFLTRIPSSALNSGVLGALCRSGALDSLCSSREALEANVDRFVQLEQERRKQPKGTEYLVSPNYGCRPCGRAVDLRREWERATLGVEVSVGVVTIRPTRDRTLSEQELEYIHRVIQANPGSSPVVFDFGLSKLSGVASMSLTDRAKQALAALGTVEVVEE